jgi:hypothetical protein
MASISRYERAGVANQPFPVHSHILRHVSRAPFDPRRHAELAPGRFKNLLKDSSLGRFTSKCVNYSTLLNRETTYRANFSLALGPVANGGFLFKQSFKTEFHGADREAPGQDRPASLIVAGPGWKKIDPGTYPTLDTSARSCTRNACCPTN